MHKLEQTIKALEKREQRAFHQFLQSPFFNQREDVQIMYAWILKGNSLADAQALHTRLYPGKPFDRQRLLLAKSYLQRLAEQFLAYQHWQEKPGAADIELVQALRQRGLEQHFETALRRAKDTLEKQPRRNSHYYNAMGQLLWEEARFEQQRRATEVRHLLPLSDFADRSWLVQKMRFLCLHRTQKMVYQADDALHLDPETEAILQRHDLRQAPAVHIWFLCLKMLEHPDLPEYFNHFKGILLEHGAVFDTEEVRDLYLFAINYCIRQVNAGNKSFFHDTMDFYKDGLLKGYLLENGVLSRFTYHNIVAAGIQTREFEWVEDFINKYKNTLERSYRESSYSFNLARLEFNRRRFDQALALLQHSNYYDPLLNLAAKTISLKIFYELKEHDLLDAHLDAMKNYIRRKAILGYHRANYLNLVRYTKKLIAVNPFDRKEIVSLQHKIQAEPDLTEREWLLDQITGAAGSPKL